MKFNIPEKLRPAAGFIKRLLRADLPGISAQTAFYLLFSLFPLIIFILTITVRFDLHIESRDLELLLPPQLANLLELAHVSSSAASAPLIWPIAVSLWSASRGIWALMRGVHRAFTGDRLSFNLRTQALALAFTLAFALSTAISLGLWLLTLGLASGSHAGLLRIPGVAASIYLFVWLLYIFTPGCRAGRRAAPLGACAATAIWLGVNRVFEAASGYIFQDNPLYGGVNAFLAVAAWVYAVSVGVLLGAGINASLARKATGSAF